MDQFERDRAHLAGESAEHLARVLRAEPGQLYELSDGCSAWLARVDCVSSSGRAGARVEFALVEPLAAREPAVHVELLLAIVKFDRFEWAIEKASELGVAEIVPLDAARSDKSLVAAAGKRIARWRKILVESAQQSRRLTVPLLHEPAKPAAAFARPSAPLRLLFSERPGAKPLRDLLVPPAQPRAVIAIGPEGGWTDQELSAARSAGFVDVSLGENILRTETAVAAALSIISFALA